MIDKVKDNNRGSSHDVVFEYMIVQCTIAQRRECSHVWC